MHEDTFLNVISRVIKRDFDGIVKPYMYIVDTFPV